MHCASCEQEVCGPGEAFTGDVCPHCQHFAHPTRLGLYEGLELVKRGGMGSVYRARHSRLGTTVAIKAVQTNAGPQTLAERFEREAELAARIPHPGIVRVYDYDCQEGRLYLVMEFVEGATLRQHIQDGSHDLGWSLDKVAQLAEILQSAHDQGIVHRDIKPENVMVDPTGRVRVLDFGISCVLEDDQRLTRTGEILGTPEYISPEQILDLPSAIDARADIYSTGVVLYELLTGCSPFAGNNLFQVLKYVESLTPPRPSELEPGIGSQLDELVMECLSKDKSGRPASAGQLARRLRSLATPTVATTPARLAPRALLAGAGLLVGALLASLYWAGQRSESPRDSVRAAALTPAQTIEQLLRQGAEIDLVRLRQLTRSIDPQASAEALYWRGMAGKRCGALFSAYRDCAGSHAAGHPAAALQARILWLYKHKLYPALLGGPRWLQAAARPPWPVGSVADPDLDAGLLALCDNALGVAAERLQACKIIGADRQVLLALVYHLQGDRVRAAEALRRGDVAYMPARMLLAVLRPEQAVVRLRELGEDIDRGVPMRYFLEAAAALRAGQMERLRAATELALVAGEASHATAVYLAARSWLQRPDAQVAGALLVMANGLDGSEAPGLRCTKAVLAHLAGSDPRPQLEGLAEAVDPAITFFQAWRDASAAQQSFYSAVLDLPRDRRRMAGWHQTVLADPAVDDAALARRMLAAGLLGAPISAAVQQDLVESTLAALERGSDLQLVEDMLSSAPGKLELADAIEAIRRAVVQRGMPAEHLQALLRLGGGDGR